jgi:hypothetical protein
LGPVRDLFFAVWIDVPVEPHDEGWDQGPGEEVAGQHGEHHGFSQRHKQVPCNALQKEHGHKHNTDAEGGNEGRQGDLLGAGQDRLFQGEPGIHLAVDVLDFDSGIVDEDSDGESEAAEGHEVDGFAERTENGQGTEYGERDGEGDDQGAAPGAQEEEDHQRGKRGGNDRFLEHA